MADNIVYQGLTFSQTPSGDWRVDTNFGSATGDTPIQAVLNAANSIASNNPNSESIQKYADGVRGIALDPATNGGVTTAWRAAQKTPTTPPPTPPQETAATTVANDSPDPANAATSGDTLSESEQQNIKNDQTGANTANYGDAVTNAIQSEADAEYGKGNVAVGPAEITTSAGNKPKTPLTNILHQYPGYTYGISLHLLSKDEYNDVVLKQKFVPNRVLVASAGKYNNTPGPTQFIRAKHFADDFYFDRLNIETIIGLNERTRETNAIKIDFTLIEPYGFTFINNLIDQCNEPDVNCKNYLDMPYLLQVDFYAMNDAGEIVGLVPNATKKIPIRLLKMDVKVGVKGAEYQFEASAYGHCAYDHSYADTPSNFEVHARTVAQFFQSTEVQGGTTDLSSEREAAVNNATTVVVVGPDGQVTPINPSLLSAQVKKEMSVVNSFGTALNDYHKDQYEKNKIGLNDRYFFEFHPDIGDKQFTSDTIVAPKDTGMADPKKPISIQKANAGQNTNDYNASMRIFQINAGSTIDKVLSDIICLSDFIQKQVNIPDGENPEAYLRKQAEISDKPLYWFKIVPIVVLREFDSVRKVWARDITYYVDTYEIRNVKLKDLAPGGKVVDPVKEYNYIYTGKNVDVFDFDIQFNMLYFNAMTFYRNALTAIYNIPDPSEDTKSTNPDSYTGIESNNNNIVPMILRSQVIDARGRANNATVTARQVAVSDLRQSLMSVYGADMLGLKLKIIGDPQYIKQDDIFYSPKKGTMAGEQVISDPRLVSENGSLSMDRGEVYVLVKFRTPTDIDESNGGIKFAKQDTSMFSGIYKVLGVVSEFSQGQFIQTLEMVRIPHQDKYDFSSTTPKKPTEQRTPETTGELTQAAQAAAPAETAPQTQTDSGTTSDNSDTLPEIPPAEEEALPPLEDPNLANVAANAEEKPITAATEPQAVEANIWTGFNALSFNEAFSQARAANGGRPGGVFTWRGKQYQTNTIGEAYVNNPVQVIVGA